MGKEVSEIARKHKLVSKPIPQIAISETEKEPFPNNYIKTLRFYQKAGNFFMN
jgi:hypothetical protein